MAVTPIPEGAQASSTPVPAKAESASTVAVAASTETPGQKVKEALDALRAEVDKLASTAQSVVDLIPGIGTQLSVAIEGIKGVVDIVDSTVDAIVK